MKKRVAVIGLNHYHVTGWFESLAEIPERARRPKSDGEQIQSLYVLHEVLRPSRPDDALAYLAFTGSDLSIV